MEGDAVCTASAPAAVPGVTSGGSPTYTVVDPPLVPSGAFQAAMAEPEGSSKPSATSARMSSIASVAGER